MSAKFIPHRCATVYINVGSELVEVTARGFETDNEAAIAEIKNSAVYGVWLMEDEPMITEQPETAPLEEYYAFLQPVPSLSSLDAADIAIEEAVIAEQQAIRKEQEEQEEVARRISLAVDEGIKRDRVSSHPGGKDPAKGKSKKTEPKKDDAPKKRGRPPKAK